MTRLVKAGIVAPDWNEARRTTASSPTSRRLVHRPQGQPEGHQDLGRPAQARASRSLTPNPFTSGAAKWNLLAAYGQASDAGKNPQAGLDYVSKLIKDHVKVQDKSGREALQTFTSGDGDVLLSYEYEATTAQKKGQDVDYVMPDDTIKIEITIAETDEGAGRGAGVPRLRALEPGAAEVRRLGLPPGQRGGARGEQGASSPTRPASSRSTTSAAGRRSTTSCSTPRTGSIAKIEEAAGVSTAK